MPSPQLLGRLSLEAALRRRERRLASEIPQMREFALEGLEERRQAERVAKAAEKAGNVRIWLDYTGRLAALRRDKAIRSMFTRYEMMQELMRRKRRAALASFEAAARQLAKPSLPENNVVRRHERSVCAEPCYCKVFGCLGQKQATTTEIGVA